MCLLGHGGVECVGLHLLYGLTCEWQAADLSSDVGAIGPVEVLRVCVLPKKGRQLLEVHLPASKHVTISKCAMETAGTRIPLDKVTRGYGGAGTQGTNSPHHTCNTGMHSADNAVRFSQMAPLPSMTQPLLLVQKPPLTS